MGTLGTLGGLAYLLQPKTMLRMPVAPVDGLAKELFGGVMVGDCRGIMTRAESLLESCAPRMEFEHKFFFFSFVCQCELAITCVSEAS